MRLILRRLAGFALLPLLSALASLALLPAISARFGQEGWTALALGQSVGAFVSVVVGLAWPVTGGHEVATAQSDAARRSIFRASFFSRLIVLLILVPMASIACVLLADSRLIETMLFMLAIAFNGLTASWYASGTGNPRMLVVNEGLTRLAGYAVSLIGILGGLGLWWYASVSAAAGGCSLILNWRTVMEKQPLQIMRSAREALPIIRQHASGLLSRVAQAGFSYGGVTIFAALAPSSVAAFAAADQVQKAANNGLAVLPLAFVAWVGEGQGPIRRKRVAVAVLFSLAAAIAAFSAWMASAQEVVAFLFAGEVAFSETVTLLTGAAIGGYVVVRALELQVMVPIGRSETIFRANTVTSMLGLAGVAVGAITEGVVGGLAAVVGALALKCCWYAVVFAGRRRFSPMKAGLPG